MPRNLGGSGVAAKQGAITNGRGGRFQAADKLTDKQAAFVQNLLGNGGRQTEAARQAGYAHPAQEACHLMRLPHVQKAIHAERQRFISGKLGTIAAGVMRDLMTDEENTPAAVRFQAAKWCLEQAGHGDKAADSALNGDKPLNEMTIEELQAFINAGSNALDKLDEQRARTIDGQAERELNPQHTAQDVEDADVLD